MITALRNLVCFIFGHAPIMWELTLPAQNYTQLSSGCPMDETGKSVFGIATYWMPRGAMSFISMSPDNDKTQYQQRVCRRCLAFYCERTK